MSEAGSAFRARLRGGEALDGIFVKTPHHQIVELLAVGSADVAVVDTEHSSFGPAELDAVLAVAHALHFPCLVRVAAAARPLIQQALDAGAMGVVVPHVDSPELAADVVRWSHYGPGGRGFSASTRAAGWGTRGMDEVLRSAAEATTVVVQIEDREALPLVDAIVSVDGIDAVFVGAADLTVALGHADASHPDVAEAVEAIVRAAQHASRPVAVYATGPAEAATWRRRGANLVCTGSDQSRIRG